MNVIAATARTFPAQSHRARTATGEESKRLPTFKLRCSHHDGRNDRHGPQLLHSSDSDSPRHDVSGNRLLSSDARNSEAEGGYGHTDPVSGRHSQQDDSNRQRQTAQAIRNTVLHNAPAHFAIPDSVDGNFSDVDFDLQGTEVHRDSAGNTTASKQEDWVQYGYPPAEPNLPTQQHNATTIADTETDAGTESESEGGIMTNNSVADSPPYLLWWSSLVGKMVVSEKEAKLLGVAWQALTTPSASHVVAFKLRTGPLSFLSVGQTFHMPTTAVLRSSDVILVDSVLSLVPPPLPGPDAPVPLIGWEAVTESGGYVGKVRDIAFDPGSGRIAWFLVDPLALPFLPLQLLTTYLLPADVAIAATGSCLYVQDAAEGEGVMRRHTVGSLDALFNSEGMSAGGREGMEGRYERGVPQRVSGFGPQQGASRVVKRAMQRQAIGQDMREGRRGVWDDGGDERAVRPPARPVKQRAEPPPSSPSRDVMDNWSDDDQQGTV